MIKINKPKKQDDGTYFADIFMEKKQRYQINTKMAYIRSVKEVIKREDAESEDATFSLTLRQEAIVRNVCDLNEQAITSVKENCATWFKARLTDELIEEYFVNTISYDKKGRFLKFRCVNDISSIPEHVVANISLTLQGIRFYKQTFLLEWVVDEVEIIQNKDDEDGNDDEDVPFPTPDDVKSIREKQLKRVVQLRDTLQEQVDALCKRLDIVKQVEESLAKAKTIEQIDLMSDDIDNLSE